MSNQAPPGLIGRLIRFCLEQKLVVLLGMLMVIAWGVMVAPFNWDLGDLPRSPVPVDAIPDIGENQQIVFTEWPGRSPQDVEDQITSSLTVSLLGMPAVKTVRSYSYFGFSSIYVIFDEDVDFYWSRSRILEKLSSLPGGTIPDGVKPRLGPDATALGQVFWYTLEGRDPDGKPAGGWDLAELRSIQDWYVRFGLMSAKGVSEVASIGGFVREYQVDVDPDAMRAQGVTLEQVFAAVRNSNIDVGARTIEVNRVEYMIRGLGFIKEASDIEKAVVRTAGHTPITVGQVANVTLGPAERRGALDKDGAEAVGGVVVARFGENPFATIQNVKIKIDELAPGLPTKADIDWTMVDFQTVKRFANTHNIAGFTDEFGTIDQDGWQAWLAQTSRDQWPDWITTSKVTVIPFYDRSGLIVETLDTLNSALLQQVLVTMIVVIVMVFHLRTSLLISMMLPLAVLMTFIAMRTFKVDANIVALSGIAIAIGTVVDMGIVMTENILRHLQRSMPDENRLEVIYRASTEVGSAILTAVLTTVVGFLPVFTMIGAEGKLFRPLAFTKTFALVASVIIALTLIPAGAHLLLAARPGWARLFKPLNPSRYLPAGIHRHTRVVINLVLALCVAVLLTLNWEPLGPASSAIRNLAFVVLVIGGLLLLFHLFLQVYGPVLRWCLSHKAAFLGAPALVLILGVCVWLGFGKTFAFVPALADTVGIDRDRIERSDLWVDATHAMPGLGKEFMPALDEGSFLLMPTTMPHASIGEAMDVMRTIDVAVASIPEVKQIVGKIGRVDSALDPAPISMLENIIHYKPQYTVDDEGNRVRQWRDHIRSPDDIWEEIRQAAQLPGTTGAPKLQPIETRIIMLQTGMRAPMGVKIKGPDLETIEAVGFQIERLLKEVPGVEAASVNADRIVGKPYLEVAIDRDAIQRYGLRIVDVQNVIQTAVGGMTLTHTVEGRERYPVRIRYMRELRDSIESLERVMVASPDGTQIPLSQIAEVLFVRGPMVIKSEDTFLVGYVTFGKRPGVAEVDLVERAQTYLAERIASGDLVIKAGVSYTFAGSYENQVRASKTLAVVLPVSLFFIFMILYFQFRNVGTTLIVFSGIAVAWAGGFLLIWLYGRPWFLNLDLFGVNLRELFHIGPINLSVAVWVGFLALFGVASDNGVVIATYLRQSFDREKPTTVDDIRQLSLDAGLRRARPALMTTATTILALIPVLTATGRGADIMIPMAIPSVGGMLVAVITLFLVPVLICGLAEVTLALKKDAPSEIAHTVP
jgi:copper/silver efflux system protein